MYKSFYLLAIRVAAARELQQCSYQSGRLGYSCFSMGLSRIFGNELSVLINYYPHGLFIFTPLDLER